MSLISVYFVTYHRYGGVLLGADRFKHYNNCASALMYQVGLAKVSIRVVTLTVKWMWPLHCESISGWESSQTYCKRRPVKF